MARRVLDLGAGGLPSFKMSPRQDDPYHLTPGVSDPPRARFPGASPPEAQSFHVRHGLVHGGLVELCPREVSKYASRIEHPSEPANEHNHPFQGKA